MQSIKKIRVMVVDDSILARRVIRDGLSAYSNMEIVGEAGNAVEARAKLPLLRPDVMTLDVEMPGMNGIDFVKSLLPQYPVPIILVSSLNLRVFDAMAVGAVDFVRKPETVGANQRFIEALANKIVVASCARTVCGADCGPVAAYGTGRKRDGYCNWSIHGWDRSNA